MTKKEIGAFVRFAEEVARGAGRILKNGFSRPPSVRYKGRIDPVTKYDLMSEKYIVSAIGQRFPGHAILAEEGSGNNAKTNFRWIIDPLDGTVDYAHGFPVYCVSVALEHDGRSVAGAVYDPERDECFTAGLGTGAHLNGRKIRVSRESNLERALLATGFAYNIKTARRNNLDLFARMARQAQGVRRLGSAALDLCWLAGGRIDGFWELYLQPWDTAAGRLIVEEAGGKVTQFDGSNYTIFDEEILASNGRIHLAMQGVLRPRVRRK